MTYRHLRIKENEMKFVIAECCATCVNGKFPNSRTKHGWCELHKDDIHQHINCDDYELDDVSRGKIVNVGAVMDAHNWNIEGT